MSDIGGVLRGALLSCAVALCTAGQVWAEEPPAAIYVAQAPEELGRHQLLVRDLGLGLREVDVIAHSGTVVSLVSAFGAGRRAVCEAVYLDGRSWLGYCDVYEFQFGSPKEWLAGMPRCRGCSLRARYAFSAHQQACGPTLLGDGAAISPGSETAPQRIALQAALELSQWPTERVAALREALGIARSVATPRLGPAIAGFMELDVRAVHLANDQLNAVNEVPNEILAKLDYERTRGLGDWLEDVVAKLP